MDRLMEQIEFQKQMRFELTFHFIDGGSHTETSRGLYETKAKVQHNAAHGVFMSGQGLNYTFVPSFQVKKVDVVCNEEDLRRWELNEELIRQARTVTP